MLILGNVLIWGKVLILGALIMSGTVYTLNLLPDWRGEVWLMLAGGPSEDHLIVICHV